MLLKTSKSHKNKKKFRLSDFCHIYNQSYEEEVLGGNQKVQPSVSGASRTFLRPLYQFLNMYLFFKIFFFSNFTGAGPNGRTEFIVFICKKGNFELVIL